MRRDMLDETAAAIKEYTDFESFAKRNTQSKTFVCKIGESYWQQEGEEMQYVVKANRFLRGMVRGLVATQLRMAKGGYDIENDHIIIPFLNE
jgi:tRNA pseudouridine38-40 synthase